MNPWKILASSVIGLSACTAHTVVVLADEYFSWRSAMPTRLLTLLLALAAGMLPADSFAVASANVVLSNGRSIALDETGFASQPSGPPVSNVDLIFISLRPGESADFSFDYAISVSDDGLPVQPLAPSPPSFISLPPEGNLFFSGPPSGVDHEQAAAIFSVGVFVQKTNPPVLQWSSDGPMQLALKTNADSFADSLSQSGTTHVHVVNPLSLPVNPTPSPNSVVFQVQLAASVLTSPIPEPAIALQMSLGGALHGLVALARCPQASRRIRRNSDNRSSSSWRPAGRQRSWRVNSAAPRRPSPTGLAKQQSIAASPSPTKA